MFAMRVEPAGALLLARLFALSALDQQYPAVAELAGIQVRMGCLVNQSRS
jgi:hypothetical protein